MTAAALTSTRPCRRVNALSRIGTGAISAIELFLARLPRRRRLRWGGFRCLRLDASHCPAPDSAAVSVTIVDNVE